MLRILQRRKEEEGEEEEEEEAALSVCVCPGGKVYFERECGGGQAYAACGQQPVL